MEQILKTGKVTRGYLGIMIQEVTPDLAKAFNLPWAQGALVGDVTADSPGAKAGLQKGDVITALNGQPISDYSDLRLRISQTAPGTVVKLDVCRNGQKQQITATLGEFPEKAQTAENTEQGQAQEMEGVQVENLSPEIAQQLNLPAGTRGVVITHVDPNSTAAEIGTAARRRHSGSEPQAGQQRRSSSAPRSAARGTGLAAAGESAEARPGMW